MTGDKPVVDEHRSRLVEVYLQVLSSDPDPAVRRDFAERLFALNEESSVGVAVLESFAASASEQGDMDAHRRVLELLAKEDDPEIKTQALERLGDLFAQLGDRRAAIESWRPAARLREDTPSEPAHARRLYERVLDTLPDDREAAERLVQLYADAHAWEKIPEVLGVVIRADEDRGAELVLRLHESAWEAGALDQFVSMVDEAAALRTPSTTTARHLKRAKARALAQNPARQAEASATYRALLESFGGDDDPREYQSFIESRPDPNELRWERRWLYEWRSRHDDRPVEALREWAKNEEAFGEVEQASEVYRRVLEVADDAERPSVALKVAGLFERLGRLEDSLTYLAPLLAAVPPMTGAREAARQMLADRTSGGAVAQRLESMATEADDATAARLLELLIDAREETATMPEARRRWHRSALALGERVPVLTLPAILRGAIDMPDEIALWDAAERVAKLGELGLVAHAYDEALAKREVPATLAEVLGRRMLALEGECSVEASVFVGALQRVLAIAPRARWALDRVKLALVAQGQWDGLFLLYDRAALAASDEADVRAELLHEAAIAARDLAGDDARAIQYFVAVRALRPDDAALASALERLFEREGRETDLIALLSDRAGRTKGAARHEYRRRVAALWLELGNVDAAGASLETAIVDGAPVADLTDLLERVACHHGQPRAIERLCEHYESVGAIGEVVRVAKAALDLATTARQRSARIHELVRVRLVAAAGSLSVFVNALAAIEADIAGDPALAKIAYRSVLVRAILARKHAATDASFEDALAGASRAIGALVSIFVVAGDRAGAARLLERGARLPFARDRQRALLHRAALVIPLPSGDRSRAIRLFNEIFEDGGADVVDVALVDRFAELLAAAGEQRKLASFWEAQGSHKAAAGKDEEARADLERAAAIWDREGAWEQAIAAYDRAAALGSVASFEALARLHATHGQWAEALPALEWLCAQGPADARAAHTLHLAEALVALGKPARARGCLEEALGESPSPEIAHDLRTRLITLYRKDGMWRCLVDALCKEGGLSEDGEARAAIFLEAASVLHERLSESAHAARLLELAVSSAPGDLALRPKLAGVLEALGQWERVAEVLVDQIELYGDRRSKERALLHHRLARALGRLERTASAFAHLQTAAKMFPTHPEILHDLAQVALGADELELAERTYRALLLALRNPKESCRGISYTGIFLDLGAIAMRKGDAGRAANLLESGLDAALEQHEDGGPFEQAFREIGRHDLVARAVESRVMQTSGIARLGALRDLVDLWKEHLGQDAELGTRVRRYAETTSVEIDHGKVADHADWAALWSIHVALGDESVLLEMVRQRVDHLPTPAEQHDLWSALDRDTAWRVGDALERAGRQDEAARLYGVMLDARPIQLETIRALAERLEAVGGARLADCFELLMALDAVAAPTLAPSLVVLREGQGDDAATLRALELGVAADPTNATLVRRLVAQRPRDAGALERLAALEAAAGAWDRAADAHARLVDVLEQAPASEDAVPGAVLALVDACERAGRTGDARAPLERALLTRPDHERLALCLERLCEGASEWKRLSELLVARADRTIDAPEKARLLVRAANLLVDDPGAASSALDLIGRARAAHPESIEAALANARIQMALGRPSDAVVALTEIVERNAGKRWPLLASVYLELGKAHLAVDELVEARDALKAGFAIDVRSRELAMLLGLVAVDLGDEKIAERALLAVVTLPPREETAGEAAVNSVAALYQLASMAHTNGDLTRARRWVDKAVHLDPAHGAARALLQRLDASSPSAVTLERVSPR